MSRAGKLVVTLLLSCVVCFFSFCIYQGNLSDSPPPEDPVVPVAGADQAIPSICDATHRAFIVQFYRQGDPNSEAQKATIRSLPRAITDGTWLYRVDVDMLEREGRGRVEPHMVLVVVPWDKAQHQVTYIGSFRFDNDPTVDRLTELHHGILHDQHFAATGSVSCEQLVRAVWR